MTSRAAKSRGMPRKSKAMPKSTSRPIWPIVIGGVVVVAVLAVLAIFLSQPSTGEVAEPAVSPLAIEGSSLRQLPASGGDPAVGQTIPTLSGLGLDGQPMSIGPDDGAQVIVVLAHWCPHCQNEVPLLTTYLADNPLPEGVRMVTLSTGIDPARPNYPPSAWLEREGWPAPVLTDDADNRGLAALGFQGFPGFIFVNADGTVASRSSGEIPTQAFAQQLAAIAP
ncbi:MAG TPA: TlpA disulfide reductase family protein [Candidatus Limnocylindria bacterium]|nr:TlpA disulfide reductase family protein [Candidatus Limnocylindria bacterium]